MKPEPSFPDETVAALRPLPPSAKLVAKPLEYEGRLTQSQLAHETLLANRTVREALNQLEETGIVTSRPSVMDARQRIYSLQNTETDTPQTSGLAPTAPQ